MTQIVADSSALILLAKCGFLRTLCDFYEVIAPSSVISEVASEEAQPRSSIRGSAEYRKEMVRILTARALNRSKEEIQ